jgi:hypothetical protein
MNQRPLPPEGTPAPDSQAEMEATIASLKLHFEAVRQREVKRVRGRLGALSSMQESAIESLTQSIIDQILRAPLSVLQAVSEGSDSLAVIETVLCIFDLDPSPGRSEKAPSIQRGLTSTWDTLTPFPEWLKILRHSQMAIRSRGSSYRGESR